jgi:O-antigen ligase
MMRARLDQCKLHLLTLEGGLTISTLFFFFFLPLHTDNSLFIAIMGICALALARKQELKLNARAWDLFGIGMAGFIVYTAAITISSTLHTETLRDWPRLLLWISCVIAGVVYSKISRPVSDKFAYALLAGIAFSILAAVIMTLIDIDRSFWQGDRLKLLSIHPSRLALYTSTVFLFAAYKILTTEKKLHKIIFFAIAVASLGLTIETNTRTLILFIPIATFFYIFLIPQKKTFFIFILSILILFFGVILATKEQQDTKRLLSAVLNISQDRTFITRVPIWLAGWEAFADAPVLGNGMHSYKKLHAAYIENNKAWLNENYPSHELSVKQAHNIILGRMVESGALGSIGFVVFYISAIICALKLPHSDKWIFVLLIYYMLIGSFDDPLYRKNDTFVLFFAGWALGHRFRPRSLNTLKQQHDS